MNTQSTHTPAPWKIGVRQPLSDKFIYGPKGEEIADCDRKTNFKDENLANARLIASAPELLGMLEEIADSKCDLINSERRIRLYALIKKAGGNL